MRDTNVGNGGFLENLLELGIKPNAQEIAEIMSVGDIAGLVYEPGALAKRAARVLGWRARSPVFRVTRAARIQLARSIPKADPVTGTWLLRDDGDRIFVFSGDGSLLVNLDDGGYSLEPGSLDHQWMS